jgi:hypothetical protein
MNFDI